MDTQWCVIFLLGSDVWNVYGPFGSEREARTWEDQQDQPLPAGTRAFIQPLCEAS